MYSCMELKKKNVAGNVIVCKNIVGHMYISIYKITKYPPLYSVYLENASKLGKTAKYIRSIISKRGLLLVKNFRQLGGKLVNWHEKELT